jgi:hypothetical protein
MITLSVITLSGLKCIIFYFFSISKAAVLKPTQAGHFTLTGLDKSKCNDKREREREREKERERERKRERERVCVNEYYQLSLFLFSLQKEEFFL